MADSVDELNGLFSFPGESKLPPDILGELQSTLRLHSITPQELFYKWESYSIKMGSEETKLDLNTARAFKKDVQEILERETRGKAHARSADKRGVHATPRATVNSDDVLGMLEGSMVSKTPRTAKGASKRKGGFQTPAPKAIKSERGSSPTDGRPKDTPMSGITNGVQAVRFADRQNAGQIVETLNDHLAQVEPPMAPGAASRIQLKSNTDLKKFAYKPMAMNLSEASEVLDDRIDEFMNLVQTHHKLEDTILARSAADKSTTEIIAVGRIASDTFDAKLNVASLVLELSRRTGAGRRVPLKVDAIPPYEFFPGQIVAIRGINATGDYFTAKEVLEVPLLPPAASTPSYIDKMNQLVGMEEDEASAVHALNIMVSAGPYTADDNLDFEPLHTLCDKAAETYADAVILIGPIFDSEHPLLASGDFDLPDDPSLEPDKATLSDAFRLLVGQHLARLTQEVPNITIIVIPSVRDTINKHISWPQEQIPRRELGLPKQVKVVTNPITISINETIFGISPQDILFDLRREEVVVGRPKESNILSRLPRHVIQQRHFFPLYPPVDRSQLPKPGTEDGLAVGMPLDVSYLKLGEWLTVRPDVLIIPSALTPFAKVVESVLVINPGPLSKRKGPGTYAQMAVHPRKITEKDREEERRAEMKVDHRIFERARVDIVRI